MTAESWDTRTGELINQRYLLLECVENAPIADRYLASDQSAKTTVAIQLLRPEFALQPVVVDRFVAQAKRIAGLGHPAIPRILAVQSDDTGIPFVVEEHFEGKTLSETIAASPGGMAPERAFPLLLPVVEAIARAHDHGVVHGQISGSCVVVPAGEGEPAPKLRRLFSPAGSDEEKKDAGDDIRSLGALFCEMLTGEIMLDERGERIRDLSGWELDSLLKAKIGLSDDIREVLERCLSESGEERPETAEELLLTLIGAERRSSMIVAPGAAEQSAPEPGAEEPPGEGKDKSYWSLSPYMEGGAPREERPVPLKKPAPAARKPAQKAAPEPPKPAPPPPAPEIAKTRSESRKPTPVPVEKPARPAIEITPREIRALANFGPVPDSPAQALPYAIRVFRRQRALRKELEERRARGAEARKQLENVLQKLGERLYGGQGSSPLPGPLRPFAGEIDRLKQSREQKSLVLEETTKQTDEETSALQAELEEAKSKADGLQAEEEALKQRLADMTSAQGTLEAQRTAVKEQIDEMRTSSGPIDESRLAALQFEHGGKAKQSDEMAAEMSRLNQQAAKLRRQIEVHAGMVRVLTQQLGAMTSSRQQGERSRKSAFEDVEAEIGREMIALARVALRPDLAALIQSPELVAEAQGALAAETRTARDTALCEQAIGSHDPGMYRYGIYTLAGGAGLLLLLVIYLLMS